MAIKFFLEEFFFLTTFYSKSDYMNLPHVYKKAVFGRFYFLQNLFNLFKSYLYGTSSFPNQNLYREFLKKHKEKKDSLSTPK